MNTRTRVAAAIVASASILAAGGGGTALASSGTPVTAHATTGTQATAAKYVVLDCSLKPVVKPSAYVIACADAGMGVQHLHWTSWTPNLASGYGTFWENDCKPSCAEGHIHYYPSLEVLWGSAPVTGHPADRRYTKLTVIFPGKRRPPVYVLKNGKPVATYPRTQTFGAI